MLRPKPLIRLEKLEKEFRRERPSLMDNRNNVIKIINERERTCKIGDEKRSSLSLCRVMSPRLKNQNRACTCIHRHNKKIFFSSNSDDHSLLCSGVNRVVESICKLDVDEKNKQNQIEGLLREAILKDAASLTEYTSNKQWGEWGDYRDELSQFKNNPQRQGLKQIKSVLEKRGKAIDFVVRKGDHFSFWPLLNVHDVDVVLDQFTKKTQGGKETSEIFKNEQQSKQNSCIEIFSPPGANHAEQKMMQGIANKYSDPQQRVDQLKIFIEKLGDKNSSTTISKKFCVSCLIVLRSVAEHLGLDPEEIVSTNGSSGVYYRQRGQSLCLPEDDLGTGLDSKVTGVLNEILEEVKELNNSHNINRRGGMENQTIITDLKDFSQKSQENISYISRDFFS